MKNYMLTAACALALSLAACGPSANEQAAAPETPSANPLTPMEAVMDPAAKTLDFATKAAKADMIEIEASKSAAGKTTNAEVKALANMLVTDHTKTSAELKAWAGKANIALPAALDGMEKSQVDNIVNADKEGFDDKYLDTVIDVHEDAIEAFNDYINNGQDAELKAMATATLPKLQAHLTQAQAIRDKINKT